MMRLGRARRTPEGRRTKHALRTVVFLGAFTIAGVMALYNDYSVGVLGDGGHSGASGAAAVAGAGGEGENGLPAHNSRHLLEGSLYPKDMISMKDKKGGAIILHVIGVMYTFIAIAVVCDDFFVPALEVIVEKYDIDDDVAGATFMAAGGSAPELFTSLIGVFIAKSNVGFGTIIGSAVFNVLFVIGACAFFSTTLLVLTWWPLARDCTFYTFDLCMLYVFFRDQKIELYESCLLLVFYFMYVFFMKFNTRVEKFIKTKILGQKKFLKKQNTLGKSNRVRDEESGDQPPASREGFKEDKNDDDDDEEEEEDHVGPSVPVLTRKFTKSLSRASHDGPEAVKALVDNAKHPRSSIDSHRSTDSADGGKVEKGEGAAPAEKDDDDDEEGIDLSWPDDRLGQVYYVIACPIMFLLAYTIPNCKKNRSLYALVFLESILYIGFFSYFMVWWATLVGEVIGISEVVMGYTFLAAGTSVPDLMSSVIVARQGLGDMAVSSSIGSNIFDITFGLPLPWALWSLANGIKAVKVESDSLNFSLVLLILMLVSIVGIIAACGWKMTNGLGMAMVTLYAIFLALVIMQSQGVIEGF